MESEMMSASRGRERREETKSSTVYHVIISKGIQLHIDFLGLGRLTRNARIQAFAQCISDPSLELLIGGLLAATRLWCSGRCAFWLRCSRRCCTTGCSCC